MLVKTRIRRWRGGDLLGLWAEVESSRAQLLSHHGRKKVSPESLKEGNARRARQAIEDGQYKKAIQVLTSNGLAPASAEAHVEMLAKHSQAHCALIPVDPTPTPIQVGAEDVVRALKSSPSGSAPGPSSFRANHFKEAMFCPSPDRGNTALLGILKVVNLLCAGRAPSVVVPHLCGASLLACRKKDGGLRPIAVGEVLRRLISKCISRAVQSESFRVLTPLQVGVGVQAGCESIVHALARVQEDSDIPHYTSEQSVRELIQCLSSVIEEQILDNIRSTSDFFALMADESTDLAILKQLVLVQSSSAPAHPPSPLASPSTD